MTGDLVSQRRYFAGLVEGNPLMNALEPSSGLLGKDYVKDTESASDRHLHIPGDRAAGSGLGLWRVSLEAVDAWTVRRAAGTPATDDRGPFARLLGTP